MNETTTGPKPPAPALVMIGAMRLLFSRSKVEKERYWLLEACASGLALTAAFVPWVWAASVMSLLALPAKAGAKIVGSRSRSKFRLAERLRRFDFESRALGWPIPPTDRADLLLALPSKIQTRAGERAEIDTEYYSHKGGPSDERFFANLTESLFFTHHLMAIMARRRWWQFAVAVMAFVGAIVGAAIAQPGQAIHVVLKVVGAVVAVLVAIDVFGEARSYERGDRECGKLLAAIRAEIQTGAPTIQEGLRLFIEYNCLLSDLPLVPDAIYDRNRARLNQAFAELC